MGLMSKLFGTHSDHELKRIYPIADKIEALEPQMQALSDEELRGKTAEFKERYQNGEDLDEHAARGLRRGARGRLARAGHEALPRPAHRRHRPPPGPHRGDEDRRGQDPRRRPARLPERHRRRGRPHRHGQRLPRQARQRVDGQGPPLHGAQRGPHSPRPDGRRAPRGLRRRHHLRHEQRARLRLPARQYGHLQAARWSSAGTPSPS